MCRHSSCPRVATSYWETQEIVHFGHQELPGTSSSRNSSKSASHHFEPKFVWLRVLYRQSAPSKTKIEKALFGLRDRLSMIALCSGVFAFGGEYAVRRLSWSLPGFVSELNCGHCSPPLPFKKESLGCLINSWRPPPLIW